MATLQDEVRRDIASRRMDREVTSDDGQVTILDGDTIRTPGERDARLAGGINAPEVAKGGTPAELASGIATDELRRHINEAGEDLLAEEVGRDIYNRRLVQLKGKDGKDINAQMVADGVVQENSFTQGQYSKEIGQARAKRLGVLPRMDAARTPEALERDIRLDRARRAAVAAGPNTTKRSAFDRPDGMGAFRSGFAQSVDGLQGSAYGFAALAGSILGDEDMERAGMEGYLRNQAEAAQYAKNAPTFEDVVENGADTFDFIAAATGRALPSLLTMAATGGAGGLAAKGVLKLGGEKLLAQKLRRTVVDRAVSGMTQRGISHEAAKRAVLERITNEKVQRRLFDRAVGKASGKVVGGGVAAGALVGSATPQAGEIYADIRSETGIEAPGTALGFATLAGTLDVGALGVLYKSVFKEATTKSAKHWAKRIVTGMGKQAPIEAGTEATQELLAVLARATQDPEFDWEENKVAWRLLNAAADGAVFGAIGGGVGHGAAGLAHGSSEPVQEPGGDQPDREPEVGDVTPDGTVQGKTVKEINGERTVDIQYEDTAGLDGAPEVPPAPEVTAVQEAVTQMKGVVEQLETKLAGLTAPLGMDTDAGLNTVAPQPSGAERRDAAQQVREGTAPEERTTEFQQETKFQDETTGEVADVDELGNQDTITHYASSRYGEPHTVEFGEGVNRHVQTPFATEAAAEERLAKLEAEVAELGRESEFKIQKAEKGWVIEETPLSDALPEFDENMDYDAASKLTHYRGKNGKRQQVTERQPGSLKMLKEDGKPMYINAPTLVRWAEARMPQTAGQSADARMRDALLFGLAALTTKGDKPLRLAPLSDKEKAAIRQEIALIEQQLENDKTRGKAALRKERSALQTQLAQGISPDLILQPSKTGEPVRFGSDLGARGDATRLRANARWATAARKRVKDARAQLKKLEKNKAPAELIGAAKNKLAKEEANLREARSARRGIRQGQLRAIVGDRQFGSEQDNIDDFQADRLAGDDVTTTDFDAIAGETGVENQLGDDSKREDRHPGNLDDSGRNRATSAKPKEDKTDAKVRQAVREAQPREQVTKHGKSVRVGEHRMVAALAKLLGIKVNIRVADEDGIAGLDGNHAGFDDGTRGRVYYQGDQATIFISKKVKDRGLRVAILGHELGHIFMKTSLDNLPKAVRDRLEAAHAKDLKDNPELTNPVFTEWFANQLNAWITSRAKPRDIVQSTLKRIAEGFRKLWSRMRNRYPLNETYGEFVDGIVEVIEADGNVAQLRGAFAKELDALGYVPRSFVGMADPENFPTMGELANTRVGQQFQDLRKKRLVMIMEQVTKDTGGAFKSFWHNYLRSAHRWLRTAVGDDGKIVQAGVLLSNAFYIIPGTRPKTGELMVDRHGQEITEGMLNARQRAQGPFTLMLHQVVKRIERKHKHLPRKERKAAIEAEEQSILDEMRGVKPRTSPEAKALGALFDKMHIYLADAIPGLKQLKNYFPQVWDSQVLGEDHAGFIAMMTDPDSWESGKALTKGEAEEVYQTLMDNQGFDMALDDTGLVFQTAFKSMKERTLKGIKPEAMKPFLRQDLMGTVYQYINSAVKRAEFDRRFGRLVTETDKHGNEKKVWVSNAKFRELQEQFIDATRGQPHLAKRLESHLQAMQGMLGSELDPKWRHAMGWLMTYENLRVLLFSTLASIPDAAGLAIRSRSLTMGWKGFQEGLTETFKHYRGKESELWEMGEMLGVLTDEMHNVALQEQYGGQFLSPGSQRVNEAFFKYTGLKHFTLTTRAMGLATARVFIKAHGKKAAAGDKRSIRYLNELGLTHEDVTAWLQNGKRTWMAPGAETDANAELIGKALNTFVNQSVLRPNAAHRPAWGSDPKFMLLFHLKSFMYSFHETITMGVWNETVARRAEGGTLPAQSVPALIALGTLLPLAAAGLAIRDWITYGAWGKDSPRSQDDILSYVLGELVPRAGLLGPAQLALDLETAENRGQPAVLAVMGPAPSHLFDVWTSEWNTSLLLKQMPVVNQLPQLRAELRDTLGD